MNRGAARLRQSVRALVLDPADHVLLVRFDWQGSPFEGGLWATPGGGIETGETHVDALRREMQEETGLDVMGLGPQVWTRTTHRAFSGWDGQVEHVYLLRTERFDPVPSMSPEQLRAENVHDVRWLSPAQVNDVHTVFAPRSLPSLLRRITQEGVPQLPLELDGL